MFKISKKEIQEKIKDLSTKDIADFAFKYNVFLNRNELEYIYTIIKNNHQEILDNPKNFNLYAHKNKFSEENFNKLNNLYNKYSNYLNFIQLTD